MSIRRTDLTALLSPDARSNVDPLWVVETHTKVWAVRFGKMEWEPCVTLWSVNGVIAQFYDQKVVLDLDTQCFKAKTVEGERLTLCMRHLLESATSDTVA